MDNKDEIVKAMEEFELKAQPDEKVPDILERYLCRVAATGETHFAWEKLRHLFLHKMNQAMKEFHQRVPMDSVPCPNVETVNFEEMKFRIMQMAEEFTGAPFTVQRLAELITNPQEHYQQTEKYLRGIEKNVLVVSTVDPFGNKIVNEFKCMYNGTEANGEEQPSEPHTPEKLSSFMPSAPVNSPALGLYSAIPRRTDHSQSQLLHAWPQGGAGGDASSMPSLSGAGEAMASNISPHLERAPWDTEFDDYMPPDKKARLSSTPPRGDDSDHPTQSVSSDSSPFIPGTKMESMNIETESDSVLSGAETSESDLKPLPNSEHASVSTSCPQHAPLASTNSTTASSSSQQFPQTSESHNIVETDSSQMSFGVDSSSSISKQAETENEATSCGNESESANQDPVTCNIDQSEVAQMSDQSGECAVSCTQEEGDDPDRRDSEGFDISPKNPETENNSPTSDLNSILPLMEHQESSTRPDPQVSSSSEMVQPMPESSNTQEIYADTSGQEDSADRTVKTTVSVTTVNEPSTQQPDATNSEDNLYEADNSECKNSQSQVDNLSELNNEVASSETEDSVVSSDTIEKLDNSEIKNVDSTECPDTSEQIHRSSEPVTEVTECSNQSTASGEFSIDSSSQGSSENSQDSSESSELLHEAVPTCQDPELSSDSVQKTESPSQDSCVVSTSNSDLSVDSSQSLESTECNEPMDMD